MTAFARPTAIVLATVLCLAGVEFGPGVLTIPLAVVLLAVLPGAGLAEALFGQSLSPSTRVLLSLGLSLVVAILGGMVAAVTVGLTRNSAEAVLAGVAIGGGMIGAYRQRRLPPQRRSARRRERLSPVEAVALVLAAALVGGVIAHARTPSSARGVRGYSVLWAKPEGGRIRLGVISQELHPARYRLVAAGSTRARLVWRLSLAPGEKWSATIGQPTNSTSLRATLFHWRNSRWVPYRRVRVVFSA